ncbi:MAG: TauD/TfdA family dioxygenase [Actinobacteria bacterium]|nr:TauD/TfdA family dioxygenase [Actinomycetota bacterium]
MELCDLGGAEGRDQLIRQLRDNGLSRFEGVADRAALVEAAGWLMDIYPHRDSGPDGVTVIAGEGDSALPGRAGFTSAELRPHTDRSSVPEPPVLLMMMCATDADHGGESFAVDGRLLHDVLAAEDTAALQALSRPRSALFGGAGGYLGSVFETTADGRVKVRLRLDELARYSPDVERVLPRLAALAAGNLVSFPLRAGQGYVLNNSCWLHGRTRFTGPRVMLRLLGDPLAHLGIRPGFTPRHAPEGTPQP